MADRATFFRWVQKFGPEIARRNWRRLNWHVDVTYVQVGDRWRSSGVQWTERASSSTSA